VREFAGLLAATMIALTSPLARAQESIRVDVNLVTVAFSLRDANGALVDNLTKDDFDVIEDAVPQRIAHFARSLDVPLTLGLIVDADPHTYFRQNTEELRTSYELAYYPTNTAKDDTFRKVIIRARRPGLTARSKTGYFSR
jgi:hypothetical protein